MTEENNPYSAPTSRVDDPPSRSIEPAERWRRFVNWMVDYIGFVLLSFVVGLAIGATGNGNIFQAMGPVGRFLFSLILITAYYVVQEGATGRTLGKLVTGTKVVDAAGGPITFRHALLRTLSRFIPFEAFSFFGSDARGWHDSLPGTYVVRIR